ncbi:TetR/AcrR family transcriptional regulator [Thermomonospora catenispora]|uniref:TetR/AcrR family transcriptional regulator n=1 Tax=Thermomonospora catenispora TaxID=2493090 RepID=UPI00112125B2|nr:TetR/AcrR family transcriptional regulator [Thermomonospora catenispora]TNY37944.1 TetR family transcriptional regulator [Thermomonospora catenispora]
MPRVADHDQRRRQVADAVRRLIAVGGLEAVTVARTAAEAGISVGLVQHYFRTKDDMLLFTYRQVMADIDARLADLIERREQAGTRIEHVVLDGIAETMPLDPRRREEWRVALAFAGRAVDEPRLAAARAQRLEDLRGRLAEAIDNGKECGEVPPGLDARAAAVRLAAYAEGLTHHMFADPEHVPPSAALAALADHLATIFTGHCRLHDRAPGERPPPDAGDDAD